jgi:hypothetical protein
MRPIFALYRDHVHFYRKRVFSVAENNAFQRRYIAVIPAPGRYNMPLTRDYIVRRVEIAPAVIGYKNRYPCMRSVGALQLGFARRRQCFEVAAHIARRETETADTGDGQMRKILANALFSSQYFLNRRVHCRKIRHKLKFRVNLRTKPGNAFVQRHMIIESNRSQMHEYLHPISRAGWVMCIPKMKPSSRGRP